MQVGCIFLNFDLRIMLRFCCSFRIHHEDYCGFRLDGPSNCRCVHLPSSNPQPVQRGAVFRRQNLTSVDVRF